MFIEKYWKWVRITCIYMNILGLLSDTKKEAKSIKNSSNLKKGEYRDHQHA